MRWICYPFRKMYVEITRTVPILKLICTYFSFKLYEKMHFQHGSKKRVFSIQIVFFTVYRKSLETNYVLDLMIHIVCLECFSLRWIIKSFFVVGNPLKTILVALKKLITWVEHKSRYKIIFDYTNDIIGCINQLNSKSKEFVLNTAFVKNKQFTLIDIEAIILLGNPQNI